jgi:predicted phage tail protein
MHDLTIKFAGDMGSRHGYTHQIKANKLSEALSYIRFQVPDLAQYLIDCDENEVRFALSLQQGDKEPVLITDPIWLNIDLSESTVLRFAAIPVAAGDNFGKFLAGVAIIAVSAFLPASIGILGASITSTTVGYIGAGIVLDSIIKWISPKPAAEKVSVIAGTIANNQQGGVVPVGYGQIFVTPTVISGGTQIIDYSTTENRGSGGFLGIGGWSETYLAPYSIAKLQVVDALCEGPIEGLVDGNKSIWLNGVPFQGSDGTYAYLGLRTENYDSRTITVTPPQLKTGTATDTAFGAPWDKVQGEKEVNQLLKLSTGAAVRRVNRPNLDAIGIRLIWQSNNNFNGTDNKGGVRTAHRISIKEGEGAWQVRHTDDIYALNTGSFEREFVISVGHAKFYEIRVERIIPDDVPGSGRTSTAIWASYVALINAKLKYPYTAKMGLEVNLQRFGSTSLERRYHIKALIIKVPSNATVRADGSLAYSGLWDGTFIDRWSSDPAWCLYDLLIKNRYGCGIAESKLDKYAFYSCSTYASELINDGSGGLEPRFSLNVLITDRQSAISLIQRIAGMFNSIVFYEGSSLVPVTDRPRPVSHVFTSAEAQFRYIGTPLRNRRNRAVASYRLPTVPDVVDYEPIEDKAAIIKNGVKDVRIEAYGCTSRGQAARTAKWLVYTEQAQDESVVIGTGLKGLRVKPGDIIEVGDTDRQQLRRWGRIRSAQTNSISLDVPVNLPAGIFRVTFELPDGTLHDTEFLNSGSDLSVLILNNPPPALPMPGASFMIHGLDLTPVKWRVGSRTESRTSGFELVATVYDPTKFDRVENNLSFVEPPRMLIAPSPALPPRNLVLSFDAVNQSIIADWDAPDPATFTASYQYQYRQIGNLVSAAIPAPVSSAVIMLTEPGEYEVQVRAVDSGGQFSGWITETVTAPLAVSLISSLMPYQIVKIQPRTRITITSSDQSIVRAIANTTITINSSAAVIPCDPFYSNVMALMPMKSSFAEVRNSLSVFDVTATINNTELDPFGVPGVAEFNGDQAFKIASPTLDLSGDFTIEMLIKPTGYLVSGGSSPGLYYSTLLDTRPGSQSSTPFTLYTHDTGRIGLGWVNSVSNVESASNKVILNSWNYISFSREGTTVRLFLNNELLITILNCTQNLSSNFTDWYVGGFRPSPPFDFKGLVGFMGGFRVSNIYRDGSIPLIRAFENQSC